MILVISYFKLSTTIVSAGAVIESTVSVGTAVGCVVILQEDINIRIIDRLIR